MNCNAYPPANQCTNKSFMVNYPKRAYTKRTTFKSWKNGKLASNNCMAPKYPYKNMNFENNQNGMAKNQLLKPNEMALTLLNRDNGNFNQIVNNHNRPLPNHYPVFKSKRGRKPGYKKHLQYNNHMRSTQMQANSGVGNNNYAHMCRMQVNKDISDFVKEYGNKDIKTQSQTTSKNNDSYKYVYNHVTTDDINDTLLYSNMVISGIKTIDTIVFDKEDRY